jgi:hypothetical protein
VSNFNKLLVLLVYFLPLIIFAKELDKKKYPPYQEIWGYDLSEYAKFNNGDPSIDVELTPNGDLAFMFRALSYKYDNQGNGKLLVFKV